MKPGRRFLSIFTLCLMFMCTRGSIGADRRLPSIHAVNVADLNAMTPSGIEHFQTSEGAGAMHVAVLCDDFDLAENILRSGRGPYVESTGYTDKFGQTAVMYAAKYKKNDFLDWFKARQFDFLSQDAQGLTALHLAVSVGNVYPLRFYSGEDLSGIRSSNGYSLAQMAAITGKVDVLEYIIEKVKEDRTDQAYTDLLEGQTSEGSSLAHLAAFGGKKEVVEFLARHGLPLNLKDKYGRVPIEKALEPEEPNLEVIEFMIRKGYLSSEIQQSNSYTLLKIAIKAGFESIAQMIDNWRM